MLIRIRGGFGAPHLANVERYLVNLEPSVQAGTDQISVTNSIVNYSATQSLTHSQASSWILGPITLGCIQSQSCHTNKCPTGVATQDSLRQRALVVPDKAQRVFNFHRNTLKGLAEMLAAAGLDHPSQLEARHLVRRMSATEIKLFSQSHVFLEPGQLLNGEVDGSFYSTMWQMARADSFEPNSIS